MMGWGMLGLLEGLGHLLEVVDDVDVLGALGLALATPQKAPHEETNKQPR